MGEEVKDAAKDWYSRANAAARLGVPETEIDRLSASMQTTSMQVEQPRHISARGSRNGGMELAMATFVQSLVSSVSNAKTVPIERRIFLSIDESAELSGLPPRFLRRLIREGTLKAVRAGSQWRIPRAELESLPGRLTEAKPEKQELSEAEVRDLEMNRLRRLGLLDSLQEAALQEAALDDTTRRNGR